MSEELKPCPFCGGDAVVMSDTEDGLMIGCGGDNCGFMGYYDEIGWNSRPLEDALRAENTRLESKKQTTFEVMSNTIARRDAWIAELEAKIPKLNVDLAQACIVAYKSETRAVKLEKALAASEKKAERYAQALAWYGDEALYPHERRGSFESPIERDMGERARKALVAK